MSIFWLIRVSTEYNNCQIPDRQANAPVTIKAVY